MASKHAQPRAEKISNRKIAKWLKATLITFGVIVILLIVGWFMLAWYINGHKQQLIQQITEQVSENIDGNFHIEDMHPALLKGFPNVSIRLDKVTLSDSLYPVHKKNLIDLKSVYVKLNLFSLLGKNPEIMKVTLSDGAIYLFADTRGYTNTYLFKKKKATQKKSSKKFEVNRFGIENVLFTFDHFERNKQFKIKIKDMDGRIESKGSLMDINASTDAYFYQLGFNLAKGGFIKDKELDADLHILFNRDTKQLQLPKQHINVNDRDVIFGCVFNFGHKPVDYTINIDAPSIPFKEGTSYLSRHIASKLDSLDLKRPISVQVNVIGSFRYPDTPLVHAYWATEKNVLQSVFGELDETDLKGEFYNNIVPDRGRGDDNSAVSFQYVKAKLMGIPFKADSLVIYGLLHPLVHFKLASKFEVEKLNAITGGIFSMKGGNVDIDLQYKGPVVATDTFDRTLYGHINIKDAALDYIPRSLSFKQCNVNIAFIGKDLLLQNTSLSSQRSTIRLDGSARNFTGVYFTDPGKVAFNWNIASNLIDLNEFRSFLAPRRKHYISRKASNRKIAELNTQLHTLLRESNMFLHVNVKKVTYRRFDASNIRANIDMTSDGIGLKNIHLNHAGGTLTADAFLNQTGAGLPFDLKANVSRVHVNQLFHAFENFGQNTLTAQNLKGVFSANVNVRAALKPDGAIAPRSMNGKVTFALDNAELNNFKPFESIKKFIFKKRNLSHITIKSLKNTFDINSGKITIHPMFIESSALYMNVEGVYAMDRGTDISIAIPLRNPQKDQELIARGEKPKKDKGIVIYLRAKDDEHGDVNISWDPLKKGVKETAEANADVMQE